MALEVEGRVIQIYPAQSGQGSRGPWKKRTFIVETLEDFPKKIAFITWNDKADALDSIKPGERVRVSFSLESREFNDRWYTDARAWRITVIKEETVTASNRQSTPAGEPSSSIEETDPFADQTIVSDDIVDTGNDFDISADDSDDDLPF